MNILPILDWIKKNRKDGMLITIIVLTAACVFLGYFIIVLLSQGNSREGACTEQLKICTDDLKECNVKKDNLELFYRGQWQEFIKSKDEQIEQLRGEAKQTREQLENYLKNHKCNVEHR